MRVELPSGAWVELRDKLSLQDRWAMGGGITITQRDGVQYLPANISDLQMKGFLGSVIEAWSFPGIPVPSQNIAGADILGQVFTDLDDFDALEEAVQPLFQKAARNRPNPKPAATTPSSSS